MAGDTFLRSSDGSSNCPVCKGRVRFFLGGGVCVLGWGWALFVWGWMLRAVTHPLNHPMPAPNHQGYIACEKCRGTGYLASWLPSESAQ